MGTGESSGSQPQAMQKATRLHRVAFVLCALVMIAVVVFKSRSAPKEIRKQGIQEQKSFGALLKEPQDFSVPNAALFRSSPVETLSETIQNEVGSDRIGQAEQTRQVECRSLLTDLLKFKLDEFLKTFDRKRGFSSCSDIRNADLVGVLNEMRVECGDTFNLKQGQCMTKLLLLKADLVRLATEAKDVRDLSESQLAMSLFARSNVSTRDIELAREYANRRPDDIEAHKSLLMKLSESIDWSRPSDVEEAFGAVQKALAVSPHDEDVIEFYLVSAFRSPDTVQRITSFLQTHENSDVARYFLAIHLANEGQVSEAQRTISDAVRLATLRNRARIELARSRIQTLADGVRLAPGSRIGYESSMSWTFSID